jgi:hypothetical protein
VGEPDDPLEVPVTALLRIKPAHLLDFRQGFSNQDGQDHKENL